MFTQILSIIIDLPKIPSIRDIKVVPLIEVKFENLDNLQISEGSTSLTPDLLGDNSNL